MEFIGEDMKRYPLLHEVYNELDILELEKIYKLIINEIFKIVCKANLVHGDLSEYNIMVKPGPDIVIIDVSQAVHIDHPNAREFLIRDIRNINRFFKYEVKLENIISENELLEELEHCLKNKKAS